MSLKRFLIVNADDFGLSEGVNRGIIEAAEHGIVTSASLMVRQPAAKAAAAYSRAHDTLSVGLHLDLGEWVYCNGEWVPLYSVVDTENADAVAKEIESQVRLCQRLLGRNPTHLDSHQHVHRNEPARSLCLEWAGRLGVALRECHPDIRYCGDFYGQGAECEPLPDSLTVPSLMRILASLPEGTTELGCHPGHDDGLATAYRTERAVEVKVLCAPEIRQVLSELNIELRSFSDCCVLSNQAGRLSGE